MHPLRSTVNEGVLSEHKNILDLGIEFNWDELRSQIAEAVGKATFQSWISPLELKAYQSGKLIMAAPTRFMRDWIKNNYGQMILDLCRKQNPKIFRVDIIVSAVQESSENKEDDVDSQLPPKTPPKIPKTSATQDSAQHDDTGGKKAQGFQASFESPLDLKYTFENFVVGKSNELAHAAARRVAETDEVKFNPLFLYGGVGLGKTHLMHSIAWHIKNTHPNRRVIYLSAEKFMYQFIRALRYRDTVAFKEQFRSVDVLMIDDVQFISGKDSTQEEFFHTFNALVDRNRQIIITADKSPSDLQGIEDRLKSRLGWGLVADVHPTTYELRLGILQSKIERLQVEVDQEVLEFLASKITSNIRELEGALNRVVAHSTLVGRPITIDTTHDVLRDLLRANDKRVTVEDIQKKVAEHFNIKMSDMHSARRLRAVARPRQMAMYLTKKLTDLSFPEIGRKFGGRDHTTVLHAVKKIEDELKINLTLAEDLSLLKRALA